ncbi:unnamed protein product, partial [Polarella glacialis]
PVLDAAVLRKSRQAAEGITLLVPLLPADWHLSTSSWASGRQGAAIGLTGHSGASAAVFPVSILFALPLAVTLRPSQRLLRRRPCRGAWSNRSTAENVDPEATAAKNALREIQRSAPPEQHRLLTGTIIEDYVRARELGVANALATHWHRSMERHGQPPDGDVCSALCTAWARTGDLTKAEGWLLRLLQAHLVPQAKAFNTLVTAFAKAGKADRAEFWLSRQLEVGLAPSISSYNDVIKAKAK